MLSRRTIRIKVLQLIYALGKDEQMTFNNALSQYNTNARRTHELYLLGLLYLIEVTRFSRKDLENRKAKHLPTPEDKLFRPKLYENPIIESLVGFEPLQKAVIRHKLSGRIDYDSIRMMYNEFTKVDTYMPYVLESNTTEEGHLTQVLQLMRFLLTNELFIGVMDDFSTCWEDDETLVYGAFKKTVKKLPNTDEIYIDFNDEDLATRAFGESLLIKAHKNRDEILAYISPMLHNWDADRVATVDMIILQLAVCELMYFETIPTKVTLNEYVEISKLYSSEKSKEFVNGVLDQLMKKLQADGKIIKAGRGLMA